MGGSESCPRKITVEEDEAGNAVKVLESSSTLSSSDQNSDKSSPSPRGAVLSDEEFERLKARYAEKIEALEKKNAELYHTTIEHFAKAVVDVEQKYIKTVALPVCGELQQFVLTCYSSHPQESLRCAPQVRAFNHCVQTHREKTLVK